MSHYSYYFSVTIITFSFYLLLLVVMVNSFVDPYKQLHVTSPSPHPNPTLFKDLIINQIKPTWARVYIPREALDNPQLKLPLVVFFHGGGFVAFSVDSPDVHHFCLNMANDTQSFVVSVNYRLAQEHRLPAQYDDAMEALHWIKTSDDSWITSHADYSRCYLMGESAGGNIAYNAGLRAASVVDGMKPVRIQGLILVQPFFGGTRRTPSELRLANNLALPLFVTDLMWNLSLPLGADRDHEYSNPTVNGGTPVLNQMGVLGWTVVMFGCDGDPLVDREMELVKLMEEKGVHVVGQFFSGGWHGMFVDDPSMANKLYHILQIQFSAS